MERRYFYTTGQGYRTLNLLKNTKTEVLFINTALQWPANYFTKKQVKQLNDIDRYIKKIIDAENLQDHTIIECYNQIHNDYDLLGGIQETHWLNLYDNFFPDATVDLASDNAHPGPESHKLMAQKLINAYRQRAR